MASANEVAASVPSSWRKYVLDPPKSRARLREFGDYCAERSVENEDEGRDAPARRFRMLAVYFLELADEAEEE